MEVELAMTHSSFVFGGNIVGVGNYHWHQIFYPSNPCQNYMIELKSETVMLNPKRKIRTKLS